MTTLVGRAWKFGDGISTDQITPSRYFHLRTNLPELAKHTLEDARIDFAPNVRNGDFVVGGKNFGLGSSREHAPIVIKMCGVNAVLAKSFARIFYRNAINIGLPVIVVDTDTIAEGDQLEISLTAGKVRNLSKKTDLSFPPLPVAMMKILEEGGLIPFVKKYHELKLA